MAEAVAVPAPFRVEKPGLYNLAAEQYHADPCPEPSASSSILRTLLAETPARARLEHPRLNKSYEPENRYIFDLGTVAHILLQGNDTRKIKVLDFNDFKKNDAQEARDRCYADGLVPVLKKHFDECRAMHRAAKQQLAAHRAAFDWFTNGRPEQTLIWQEDNGLWCRCMLDWLPDAHKTGGNVFYDYKSTAVLPGPDDWGRRLLFDDGYDVQCAFYRRGIQKVLGIENPQFSFVVQQNKPPYLLAVNALAPMALELAEFKMKNAMAYFSWCLKNNRWPGYSRDIAFIDPPPWWVTRVEEQHTRSAIFREAGVDELAELMHWDQGEKQ